ASDPAALGRDSGILARREQNRAFAHANSAKSANSAQISQISQISPSREPPRPCPERPGIDARCSLARCLVTPALLSMPWGRAGDAPRLAGALQFLKYHGSARRRYMP